jgi:EmrB/QacA subfamily drug resistance transporter
LAVKSASPDLTAIRPLLPWLVAVAFFMEALDTTILNTGVPVIAEALDVTALSMKAVLSSYTLALAVFIPISGWMADRFGTRRVFASAIGIFTLGSLLCGLSTNIHWLVAFRVLQGMGGAMMVPVGRLIMVRSFDHRELVRAMSFVAIPMLVAPMLGPLLGGLIVDYLHWRVIFFVNIPVGLAGMALVALKLPNFRDPKPRPLDFLGLILFGSGIALLSYVLEVFGEHRLGVGGVLGLLAISGLLLFGYGLHAAKTPFPLLLLGLFRIRTFATSVSGGFITRLGVGGVPFLLPLLYQVGLGMTPVQSGLLIMPQALGAMSSKLIITRLLDRFGYAAILRVNTLIIGVLLALFGFVGARTPVWLIIALALVYGLITSIQYTSMNTLAYADVPRKQTSGASTIASTLQQLSVSFGVAVAGLITLFFLPADTDNRALMIGGLHKAFWLLGGFTIVSTLIFATLRKGDGEAAPKNDPAGPPVTKT